MPTLVFESSDSQSGSRGPPGDHTKILKGDRRMTEIQGATVTSQWATATSMHE